LHSIEKREVSNSVERWRDPPDHWPEHLRNDFVASLGNGRVGTRLVSENERVRIWHLSLAPGERIGFHTHVLDYFWTAMTGGRARSHYGDGGIRDVVYQPGDTQHHKFQRGEFMIHDLENVGEAPLVFATVEFLDSANAPLEV
jgi:mannose-6-phosphate isomerase-like protein (cupin superfamily)